MVLGQALSLGKGVIDWFINSVPKPFKIILFLFILGVLGATINGLFVVDYSCDMDLLNRTQLVDTSAYANSGTEYMTAYFYKANISIDQFNLTDKSAEYNETVRDFVKWTELSKLTLGVADTFERFFNAINNVIFRTNFSGFEFVTRFQSPQDYYCIDLYASLPQDINTKLGLHGNCTIDDIPTPEEFAKYTRVNVSGQINEIFNIQCVDKDPRLTAVGFDFLNWKMWVLVLGLSTAFIFSLKWQQHLRNH